MDVGVGAGAGDAVLVGDGDGDGDGVGAISTCAVAKSENAYVVPAANVTDPPGANVTVLLTIDTGPERFDQLPAVSPGLYARYSAEPAGSEMPGGKMNVNDGQFANVTVAAVAIVT